LFFCGRNRAENNQQSAFSVLPSIPSPQNPPRDRSPKRDADEHGKKEAFKEVHLTISITTIAIAANAASKISSSIAAPKVML